MIWYSNLFQNFQQFIVIHIVKGFDIVNKAEIDVFLELRFFLFHLVEISVSHDSRNLCPWDTLINKLLVFSC